MIYNRIKSDKTAVEMWIFYIEKPANDLGILLVACGLHILMLDVKFDVKEGREKSGD